MHPVHQNSRVVTAKDGKWLYTQMNTTHKWRFPIDISKLDPLYLDILIAFEDKRFWKHLGVDPLAMGRALFQLIKNGRVTSGGSTITMQLARLLEPKKRTVRSKIIEIIRAFQLEMNYSKEEILQAYLTLAPYGGNVEGIVAASLKYFGKFPYALSVSEAALLVSLPQSPEQNRPDRHPQRSKKARDKVISVAKEQRIITKQSYAKSLSSPTPRLSYPYPRYTAHLSQKLLKSHRDHKIKTTLDATLQKQLEYWALSKENTLPKGSTLALLVVENNSSEIKAYIGSHSMFSPKIAGYVDMIQSPRSPGSTLKPFIYGIGFEQHIIHPSTLIYDRQTRFGDYLPHNFSRQFTGEVSISYALQHSLNIPVVKILQKIGSQTFTQRLERLTGKLHVPKEQATLPVALGGLGISIWQMVQLYVALANGGKAKALHYLPRNLDSQKRILSAEAAKMTTAILREISPPKGYKNKNNLIAYKTGTSYGYRDFWTAAYIPQYTTVVWVGKADNSQQLKQTGRQTAAPLAFEIISMIAALYDLEPWSWQSSYLDAKAPMNLAHFDKEIKDAQVPLEFIYPKDGSRYYSAGCHDAIIQVAIENGKPPYYWYVDGKATEINQTKHDIQLGAGAHNITVIDSMGDTLTREIWVFTPDCQEKK